MNLKILQPKNTGRLKITLQKTGKMGFSSYAHRLFNFDKLRYVKFGYDDKKNWYLKVLEEDDGDCFKISKAGEYYYVNLAGAIVQMGLKRGETIVFNLISSENGFFLMSKNK